MNHFWRWTNAAGNEPRVLTLDGTIAEETWYEDEISPKMFREELNAGTGDIVVWINSPGGDCVAAAQIYNMLMEYRGDVTVKIDGIAASAASVVAMAGTRVLMSPVSMMMIHNPATMAWGDHAEMKRAMELLNSVKESILNAYEIKTGLGRDKLSRMMDAVTWMDAGKAMELGFSDGTLSRDDCRIAAPAAMLCSPTAALESLREKLAARCRIEPAGRRVDELLNTLNNRNH